MDGHGNGFATLAGGASATGIATATGTSTGTSFAWRCYSFWLRTTFCEASIGENDCANVFARDCKYRSHYDDGTSDRSCACERVSWPPLVRNTGPESEREASSASTCSP